MIVSWQLYKYIISNPRYMCPNLCCHLSASHEGVGLFTAIKAMSVYRCRLSVTVTNRSIIAGYGIELHVHTIRVVIQLSFEVIVRNEAGIPVSRLVFRLSYM